MERHVHSFPNDQSKTCSIPGFAAPLCMFFTPNVSQSIQLKVHQRQTINTYTNKPLFFQTKCINIDTTLEKKKLLINSLSNQCRCIRDRQYSDANVSAYITAHFNFFLYARSYRCLHCDCHCW